MRTAVCIAMALALAGCGPKPPPAAPLPPAPPAVQFKDVTREVGIDFTHFTGATGKKYLPETMGAGCAFLDYDNDGRLDILFVNGAPLSPGASGPLPTMRLYHNDGGHFRDVTHEMGLDFSMYGMGVAVGDYDNDGYEDLFITGVGGCRLFHNELAVGSRQSAVGSRQSAVGSRQSAVGSRQSAVGKAADTRHPTPDTRHPTSASRHFRDVTAESGVGHPGWSTSATWVDYDRDGLLDLFVCHYVQWTPATDKFYSIDGVRKTYSTPQQYPGESCRLFRNLGHGNFKDVTREAGIFNTKSKALGVVVIDYDQDGWPDIAVANDTESNFLFHNETNGTFKEVALETGIAVAATGTPKAGMGIDTADEMNTGMESIVITNFAGEQLTLYRPESPGHFLDAAATSGLGSATQLYLGFGVFFFDYDGDGWQDLLVYNGHIQEDALVRQNGVQYREPALLLWNEGGKYRDVTASAGSALQQTEVGRGAAWGDFDNDGRPDILLTSNGGPARLLHNENHTGTHWLRLTLVGTKSNRDAIGARVRVKVGDRTLSQTVKGASSYLSQSDRRLLFGLGRETRAAEIQIQWPDGEVQTVGPTPGDRSIAVVEGKPSVPQR